MKSRVQAALRLLLVRFEQEFAHMPPSTIALSSESRVSPSHKCIYDLHLSQAKVEAELLDCSDIQQVTTTDVERIIRLHLQLAEAGRRLVLKNVGPSLQETLDLTRVSRMVQIG